MTRGIPICPECGYNLQGLMQNRCPECGNAVDLIALCAEQDRQEQGWPSNGLLVAAIFIAAVQFSLGLTSGRNTWVQVAWFATAWGLALSWVWMRRRAIRGESPWLLIWILLVALWAPERPNLQPPLSLGLQVMSGTLAAAALGYLVWRSPKQAAGGLALLVGLILGFGALAFMVGALVAGPGASFSVFGAQFPGGGLNNLIAAMVGVVAGLVAFGALRLANLLLARRM